MDALSELDQIAQADAPWLYSATDRREHVVHLLDTILQHLQLLDLRLAVKKAEDIRGLVARYTGESAPAVIAGVVNGKLRELRERISQSLEDRTIYFVPPNRADYIRRQAGCFSQATQDKLADVSYDLAEAALCLGMARNTACVFHLMRAMEFAVQRLGDRLGVTVVDKHNRELPWGQILGNVSGAIERLPVGPERDALSGIHAMLYSVKQAWRNSTMHPRETYTDEEAEALFGAVRAFLATLADSL